MTSSMHAIEIPCCLCGTMILPNAANQCTACLAQEVDLKAILQRGPGGGEITIHQCRQCRRHQRSEKVWDLMEPESPELLALCLKSIPALAPKASPKMHLADAIWGKCVKSWRAKGRRKYDLKQLSLTFQVFPSS